MCKKTNSGFRDPQLQKTIKKPTASLRQALVTMGEYGGIRY